MIMLNALILAGHESIFIDATNTTKKRRDFWKIPDCNRRFYVFNTPKDVCITRAKASQREDLVEVIERMSSQYEPPTLEEGECVEVDYLTYKTKNMYA